MLLFLSLAVLPLLLPCIVLFTPFLLPTNMIYERAFATVCTQMIFAVTGVSSLLPGGPFVRSLAQSASLFGIAVAAPPTLIRTFLTLIGTIGPLVCIASSVVMVHATRVASRWCSSAIGSAELSDRPAVGLKVAVLATAAAAFTLAARWTYCFLTLTSVITVGRVVQAAIVVGVCAYLTIRCIRSRRGVLSEAAVTSALITSALLQIGVATLAAEDRDAYFARGGLVWLLDRCLPIALDVASLSLLLIEATNADDEAEGERPTDGGAASSYAWRALAVLLLTHLLHLYVGDDVSVSSSSDARWWSAIGAAIGDLSTSAMAWTGLAASNGTESEGVTAASWSLLPDCVTSLWTHRDVLSALARGVAALAAYARVIEQDRRHEEEGHED